MQVQALPIFWLICILWAIYYWYWDTQDSTTQSNDNNIPKIFFDFNSDKRQSTSSIDSIDQSDNEDTRRKNIHKVQYEIKTRWPSRTSLRTRDFNMAV